VYRTLFDRCCQTPPEADDAELHGGRHLVADAKGLEPLLPCGNQPFREALVLLYEHPLAET